MGKVKTDKRGPVSEPDLDPDEDNMFECECGFFYDPNETDTCPICNKYCGLFDYED